MTFGEEIRRRREAVGFSLRDVASKLAISPAYLSRLERDLETPTDERILQIAELLDAPPDELFSAANRLAPDLVQFIASEPALLALLRVGMKQKWAADEVARLAHVVARWKR